MESSIGIVLLNYNNSHEVFTMVQRLNKIGVQNKSIIVVDNHSTDHSFEIFRRSLPVEVKLIESSVNRGFGFGNNIGIREALKRKYKYICILNSDVQFSENFIDKLAVFLTEHSTVGMVGPCVCYSNSTRIASCGGEINFLKGQSKFNYNGCEYVNRGPIICDYVSGGCVLVRSTALAKVGLIPEAYFLNYEDNEWAINFIRKGFKVICLSSVIVYHDGEGTIGKINGLQQYFMARNRILFERRNANVIQKIIFYPYFLIVFIFSIASSKRRPLIKAYLDGFTGYNKYQNLMK